MLREAEETVDDQCNGPKVSTVWCGVGKHVCLAKAKALPQQATLQHDTDARKYADMLNGGIHRFRIMHKGQLRLTITQEHY